MGPRQRPKGSGSIHFREAEIDRLLNTIDRRLPRGDNEWQIIADDFNSSRPREFPEREKDSLRNKFKALRNVRKPTGDPTIPVVVRRHSGLLY